MNTLANFLRACRATMAFVSLVLFLAMAAAPSAAFAAGDKKLSEDAYHDVWRKLWEDHISWTRSVIIGILDLNTDGSDPYTVRLLQNPGDMANALAPYYKADDVATMQQLITAHLGIAAQILIDAKADPTLGSADLQDQITLWYQNGDEIAAKMAEMNPTFWPLLMGSKMWKDHLDATLNEAVSHLKKNFADEVTAVDLVHSMALTMADFFSNGVTHQFKGQFTRAK